MKEKIIFLVAIGIWFVVGAIIGIAIRVLL